MKSLLRRIFASPSDSHAGAITIRNASRIEGAKNFECYYDCTGVTIGHKVFDAVRVVKFTPASGVLSLSGVNSGGVEIGKILLFASSVKLLNKPSAPSAT